MAPELSPQTDSRLGLQGLQGVWGEWVVVGVQLAGPLTHLGPGSRRCVCLAPGARWQDVCWQHPRLTPQLVPSGYPSHPPCTPAPQPALPAPPLFRGGGRGVFLQLLTFSPLHCLLVSSARRFRRPDSLSDCRRLIFCYSRY